MYYFINSILAPEWGIVFLGIIALTIVLGCAFLIIRKLFGKKRHGEKNKAKGGFGAGGFKGFFKPGAGPDGGVAPNMVIFKINFFKKNFLILQKKFFC